MMHGAATPDSVLWSTMWHETASMSIEPSTPAPLDVYVMGRRRPLRTAETSAHNTAAINSVDLVTHRYHVSSHASSRSTSSTNVLAYLRHTAYLNTYHVVIKGACLVRFLFSSVRSHFTHHTAEQARFFQLHFQASNVEATGVATMTTVISREEYPSTFCPRKEMNDYYSAHCRGKIINHVRRAEQADRLASVLRTTSFDAGVDRAWKNCVTDHTRTEVCHHRVLFSLAHVLS